MYGVLLKHQLVDISFMSILWMLIVALPGFIFLNINLRCFKLFFSFNNTLNLYSIKKSYKFFADIGIFHRVSCPHTHQQNGTAKRKHRHIVETGLTLLAHASVPFSYWSDAFATACFLINRLPSCAINMQTPLERVLGETPNYTFFRVFGCMCWPHL
jgi:hypothetical protein